MGDSAGRLGEEMALGSCGMSYRLTSRPIGPPTIAPRTAPPNRPAPVRASVSV
jgi:hypothetical protein